MRCVAAVLVAYFIAVDSVPIIGIDGIGGGVPASPGGQNQHGMNVGLTKEGSLKVEKVETTHTEEDSEKEEHEDSSYDQKDTSGDGTHTVSSDSQHDKKHSEHRTKDKTKSEGLELGKGGLKATKEETTKTDKKTHDSESGSTSFKKTDKYAKSENTEESGSNFKKEEDTQDTKTVHKKEDMDIGFGKKPTVKKEEDVEEEHKEHKEEEGSHFDHKTGYEKDGNHTIKRESGSGGGYKKASDKSSKSSSHANEEKTYDDDGKGEAEAKKGHHHHHHHHHIPHGVYHHLKQDSRRLGLIHGSVQMSGESHENHASPAIRQDYLLTLAHKIRNAKASAGRGNARIVGPHHHSGEYSNAASRYFNLKGSPYRTLAQKFGHSPVSSHYANAQIVEARYSHLPSYYISTGSKYKLQGTDMQGTAKLEYPPGKSQYTGKSLLTSYRTPQEGTGYAQYSTAVKQYDVSNLQLTPAEWEERARINAENLNEQYNVQRSIGKETNGRQYNHGYVKRAYIIEPDIKNAILSQNVMNVLKKHGEHYKDTSKDVISILNGHSRSAEKIHTHTLAARIKQNKINKNDVGDVGYSNDDNEIIRHSEDNIVNSRYGKTETSNGATKYNAVKVDSVDSYGKSRKPFDDNKHNDDIEAFDSTNNKTRDSNSATKYSDDGEIFDSSNTTLKDSHDSVYNDIKEDSKVSKGGSNTEATSENSITALVNNDSNFGENTNGNGISDSDLNVASKVNYDESTDSITNSGSNMHTDNMESSTIFDKLISKDDVPVSGVSQATKNDSANYNATSADLEKSNFNVDKADDYIENDSVIVNSTYVDSEVKTKSEKYIQDISDTDSITMVTKSVSDSFDETGDVKSTAENIGFRINDTSSGSDTIEKETLDTTTTTTDHSFDSTFDTSISGFTTESSNATDTDINISDANFNVSNSMILNSTPESDTIVIDTTEKSDGSTDALLSTDISDDRPNSTDTIVTTTISNLDTIHSYDSPADTTVFDVSNASVNSTDTEISDMLIGNSNDFDSTTNATSGSDTNNLFKSNSDKTVISLTEISDNSFDTKNSSISEISGNINIFDSNSDTTVIAITKASDNSTDTGTIDIFDSYSSSFENITPKPVSSDVNSPNSDITVIGITKTFDNSTEAGNTVIYNSRSNGIDATISYKISESDTNNLTMTSLTKPSENLTDIRTTDITDVNSNDSNKTIENIDTESDTDNNDSTSDITLTRTAKASGDPIDTPFTDISDSNYNFSDSQNLSIATLLSDSSANNLTTDSTPTEIANSFGESASTDVPLFDTNSDSESTNIKRTRTSLAESSLSIDDINNSYSEANVTSTASVFEGSNNSTATTEAYASFNGSDSSSQAKAIADANIETGASSATAGANASNNPKPIDVSDTRSGDKNNPSNSYSEVNTTSTVNAFDGSNNSTAAVEAYASSDDSDTSSQTLAIAEANVGKTGASSATEIENAPIGLSDTTYDDTNNPSNSYSEVNATSTANAFDGSNNSTAAVEAYVSSDDSDTSNQTLAISDANIDETDASLAAAVANAASSPTPIGISDTKSDDTNNPSNSYSEISTTSTANAFDGTKNSADTVEASAGSDGPDPTNQAKPDATIDKIDDSLDSAVANSSSGPTPTDLSDGRSDDSNNSNSYSEANAATTANAEIDIGSSKDDASAPNSNGSEKGSPGFSDDTNTAVTSDVPKPHVAGDGSAKHPTTDIRALGDKNKTKKPLTVTKYKNRRREPTSLVRDVDATESKSDENGSNSDEGPILTGVDSANTYDSGSSIEES